MKVCKNYREFKKILRKYGEKKAKANDNNFIWLMYNVTEPSQFEEIKGSKSYLDGGYFKDFIDEVIEYSGQKVSFGNVEGILKGIQITNEDYYYIYEASDGSVEFITWIAGILSDV